MKIIARARRQGKTQQAILDSARTGATIICPSAEMVRHTKVMAKDMGKIIPEPLNFNTLNTGYLHGRGISEVIIDNADLILQNMIPSARVIGITVTKGRNSE